ncbi:MAG TPA: hypothetical protein PK691_02420 [Thermomicrobiales bacterium]|nr:hypothetical protein [Thermomicrobiales bacterium]HRA48122.1 hypothetical protein [Thermomicrobiales bacterium]
MLPPTTILTGRNDAHLSVNKGNLMDVSIDHTDLSQYAAPPAVAVPLPEDDLAFFTALWFWIPASLGLWAAIVWLVIRLV